MAFPGLLLGFQVFQESMVVGFDDDASASASQDSARWDFSANRSKD
jgi:hypothetical protein